MQKQKHNRTYSNRATKRIRTKRKWLALAIAFTIGLSVICIADTLTARSLEPEPEQPKPYGFPISEDKKDLTVQDLIAIEATKSGVDINTMLKLAFKESRFDQYAINVNKNRTVDRGIFQWNDYWHREISDKCAFDVSCASQKTAEAIKKGKISMWVASKYLD